MTKKRIIVIAILTLLTGWTGLLGGAGVAVLCIHGGDFIHFLNEETEIECCDEKEEQLNDGFSAIIPISECDHCFDVEIKGPSEDTFSRTSVKDIPVPTVAVSQRSFLDLVSSSFETNKHILPLLRAPPSATSMIDLGIKKTVLRL